MRVWWNFLALCFASVAASAQVPNRCSAPPKYPHTRLVEKFNGKTEFAGGDKVYYNCAEDFTPSRGSRAVQCVGRKWTKLTLKCEKKSCGNAGDLPNGQFEYEGNSFVGEKVFAKCNEGYTLKGLNYMICKKSGWTGEVPTCEAGQRDETVGITCSPPAVANSLKSGGEVSAHRVGDYVTFACSPGFQLDGARRVTCGPGGRWEPPPPRCLPSPDDTRRTTVGGRGGASPAGVCGAPPTAGGSNAHLADRYFALTSFASGDRVHYACDVGHVQAGGSRYRTCRDGTWTPLVLRCEPKLCGSAGEIPNGKFMYTGVEFGDTATAVCDEGYSLVGRATRNCMSEGWDGRVPECEAVVCAKPPEVTNGKMKGPQEPPYTYRSVVEYWCHEGTLTGQRVIWCTRNGTWSAPAPKCTVITCPSPNVPGAYWMEALDNVYRYRDTISIDCHPGHSMIGPNMVSCGHDGQWSPGLPTCRRTWNRGYWGK